MTKTESVMEETATATSPADVHPGFFAMVRRPLVAQLGLLGVAVGALYWQTLVWLVDQWMDDRVYSHGFLVPLIAGYIVWIKRFQLARIQPRPAFFSGAAVLLASLILVWIGRIGSVVQAEGLSLLLVLPGIVIFLWGWAHFKALFLPLFYLQFMVPWMDVFFNRIQYPLQLVAAKGAAFGLELLGYPVFMNRTFIQLPNISVVVARECSGVNFLISVVAIALPLTYLTQKTWWRAAGVIVAGCACTVLANSFRVMMASIVGNHYGAQMLHGPGHILRGFLVAVIGWVCVFLINWWVSRVPGKTPYLLCDRWQADAPGEAVAPAERHRFPRPLLLIAGLFFGVAVLLNWVAVPRPVAPARPFSAFPNAIGSWQGVSEQWIDAQSLFMGIADQQVFRAYRGPDGSEVKLFIGYYPSQDSTHRLVSYYDAPLYKTARRVETRLSTGGPRTVNLTRFESGGQNYRAVFWYWLPTGERVGRLRVKLETLTNALFKRSNNGAVFVLAKPVQRVEDGLGTADDFKDFLQELAPVLKTFLPAK